MYIQTKFDTSIREHSVALRPSRLSISPRPYCEGIEVNDGVLFRYFARLGMVQKRVSRCSE